MPLPLCSLSAHVLEDKIIFLFPLNLKGRINYVEKKNPQDYFNWSRKKNLIKFNTFSSWKTLKKLEIKRETPTYSNPAKTRLLLALCVDNQITYNNLEFGFFVSSSLFFCFSFYLFHEPIKSLSRSHPYEHPGLPPAFKGKPFHDLPFFPLAVPWGLRVFPHGSASKESACNVGDLGLIPGLGRSPGGGKEFHRLYSPWGRKESDMTERFSL